MKLFQGCDSGFISFSFCSFHLGSFDIGQQQIRLLHQQLLLSRKKNGDNDDGDKAMLVTQ